MRTLKEYATCDAHVCGVQAEGRVLYAHEVPPLASDERVIIVCFQLPITASRCNVQRAKYNVQRSRIVILCRPLSVTASRYSAQHTSALCAGNARKAPNHPAATGPHLADTGTPGRVRPQVRRGVPHLRQDRSTTLAWLLGQMGRPSPGRAGPGRGQAVGRE